MKYIYYPFAVIETFIASLICFAILSLPFALILGDIAFNIEWNEDTKRWKLSFGDGLDFFILQADFIYSVALIGFLIYVL